MWRILYNRKNQKGGRWGTLFNDLKRRPILHGGGSKQRPSFAALYVVRYHVHVLCSSRNALHPLRTGSAHSVCVPCTSNLAPHHPIDYTMHSFTLQWETPTMLDILAHVFGTFYFIVIVVFILAVIISGFGGWKR